MWTDVLIKYWCEHYYELRSYELLPFERHYYNSMIPFVAGMVPSQSPYEDVCDLNWQFDKALKKLGKDSQLFQEVYLDGYDETKASKLAYKKFSNLIGGDDRND
jgi:hypothetical protein